MELRKILYQRYSSLDPLPKNDEPSLKKEDEFILKVRQVLEANLEDDEFGITRLCSELSVSHAQLYRKFKSLSNRTIAEYLKILRLHRAQNLLAETQLNITQVAFAVGFKNLSHFSREFTRKFGKSPSEFRNGFFKTPFNIFQIPQI